MSTNLVDHILKCMLAIERCAVRRLLKLLVRIAADDTIKRIDENKAAFARYKKTANLNEHSDCARPSLATKNNLM